MKLSLKDRDWGVFFLDDLFDIYSTSSSIDRNKLNAKSGRFPYITRTDKNNGYDDFVQIQAEKYKIDKANVITVGLDTQTVFYQPYPFYTGQNIQILSSEELNKYIALYLIPLISIQMTKFNWGGNGATLSRLKRSKILLPITPQGKPDYPFMEAFMRQKEKEKKEAYKYFIQKRYSEIKDVRIIPLSEKEWGKYKIADLFILEQGKSKGLNHLQKTTHGISYLGATNNNNAVLTFVEMSENLVQRGNCIAFIRNGEGSMGYSVYKEEDFIATSDISVGYNEHLNRYNGLFITTIADKVRGKYNFGYKRSGERLAKEVLRLPTNSKGEPDYNYMEQYMKLQEYKKLKEYLSLSNEYLSH